MKEFIELIVNNEDWLMQCVLYYAKKFNYDEYIYTQEGAWSISVNELSNALITKASQSGKVVPELNPHTEPEDDPLSVFGKTLAAKQISGTNRISVLLGLLKYYRQSFMDLVETSIIDDHNNNHYKLFTERCFDTIEISFCNEWLILSGGKKQKNIIQPQTSTFSSNNVYHTIFENSYTPIVFLDENNRIINYNFAAAEIFISANTTDSYQENSRESLKQLNEKLQEFIQKDFDENIIETEIDTGQGKRFFHVKLKSMHTAEGKQSGTIVMFDDITRRKEAEMQLTLAKEKAEEADKLKTAFLANMSHEIRTPMNAILGFSKMLTKSDTPEDKRSQYIEIIKNSTDQLLTIINDIVDISKIEAHQIKIDEGSVVMLNDLIGEIHSLFRPTAELNNLKLTYSHGLPDMPSNIYADGVRLRQILTNLLSNALKFTSQGYIKFGYILKDSFLEFFVEDSGIGISQDKQELIFERFSQADLTTPKLFGGTGLGLSIAKALIELHGGKIWLKSQPDKGSVFYFTIPYRPVYANKNLNGEAKKEPKENNWDNITMMIAEDEEINYLFLKEFLSKTHINLIRARNGHEAIELYKQHSNIDLILMDIKMPVKDGYEATKQIKLINHDVPIIAQTAYVFEDDKIRISQSGFDDYISKPINEMKLINTIKKFIEKVKT